MAAATALLSAPWSGAAEPRVYPEYEVKAALLLRFATYVDWPGDTLPQPGKAFVIGILGDDPFGELIDETVARRASDDRPVEVRRLERVEQAEECQIVFISRAERHRQADLLAALNGHAILTVGESERFLRDGGGINLVVGRDSRVKLEVNLAATDRAGLKLSSRMLSLAQRVIRSAGPAKLGE